MDHIPLRAFHACVDRYGGNYKIKKFSCLDQFLCMAFAQLTYRDSLRDIEICLRTMESKLYHMGIQSRISRSTLADANETRDWHIYADFAKILIGIARKMYAKENLAVELDSTVYALDSTTVDLCLSMFPWAFSQQSKSAVKIHALLDLRGCIPEFIYISGGKAHDVKVLDLLIPEPGAFYIMDRGYIDFRRLNTIQKASAFFVVRAKKNLKFARQYSRHVDKRTGLRCDQTIILTYGDSALAYPEPLRRIRFYDSEGDRKFVFITNNFTLDAGVIPRLYKERWKIETFFKWIKQNLRIKSFYGTSSNAVKIQIWIAVSVYVLVAIMKKRLRLDLNMTTILQILSVTIFEKSPILCVFQGDPIPEIHTSPHNQLNLFKI